MCRRPTHEVRGSEPRDHAAAGHRRADRERDGNMSVNINVLVIGGLAIGLLAGLSAQAAPGEGCDNGVPVGGTACAGQGDPVQYRCLAGSKPGASNWTQESCNGGTCQGAACKAGPPAGADSCDNGVPVGGTACKAQGDAFQYRCLAGSKPGKSKWNKESCNGATCQGAACKAGPPAPPPPPPSQGCGEAGLGSCGLNPDGTYSWTRCDPPNWAQGTCPRGQDCWSSVGIKCVPTGANCDGKRIGETKCASEGGKQVFECVLTGQHGEWQPRTCGGALACHEGACVPAAATCDGSPLGATRCIRGNEVEYERCAFSEGTARWTNSVCAGEQQCVGNACIEWWNKCETAGQKFCAGGLAVNCTGNKNGTAQRCMWDEFCNNGQCLRRYSTVKELTFRFSSAGPIAQMNCTQVHEAADPGGTWNDNYFCASRDLGMRWSSAGPIFGMRCTQINEPAEPPSTTWNDNYLCLPKNVPTILTWSFAGPIPGKTCIAWNEVADPHTWGDNFACF